MDFIKRFPFIQKFKDNNNKNSATSLGRQKSKRSIFSHHTNDRLVSCRMNNARDVDSDDDDQDDDDQDEYNSNTLIFRQKPLNAITITTTNTNKPKTNTSKSKSARPTHQFYMHHHKDSSSTVKSQLLSLSSSNDIQQHKQLSITFEGKDAKYPNKHEKPMVEENYHHKQEKLAMRHPEKVSTWAHLFLLHYTDQQIPVEVVSFYTIQLHNWYTNSLLIQISGFDIVCAIHWTPRDHRRWLYTLTNRHTKIHWSTTRCIAGFDTIISSYPQKVS